MQVVIVRAADGAAMGDRVAGILQAGIPNLQIVAPQAEPPDTWDNVVVLFLMTNGGFADLGLAGYVNKVIGASCR